MFGPTKYIAWAQRFHGSASFDLATSGIPPVRLDALGPLPDLDDPDGYARLVPAIARYNDVDASEVCPTLGTSGAVFLAYAALLSAGDEILVEHAGYEPLSRTAEGLGVTVRRFDRRAADGFAIDVEQVAALVGPKTRAIVVSTLHNPSGVRTPDAILTELADIIGARGGWLVVDEVYAPFDDLPTDGIFRRSARKLAANVVATASLTKAYGLGMQRIGWLLGPEDVVARAKDACISTVGHLPLAHANLAVHAFAKVGLLAERAHASLEGKRDIAAAWASAIGAEWSRPGEGLFGFASFPGRGDLRERIESGMRSHAVLVVPGVFFGEPEGFRLAWAAPDPSRFAEGLERLEKVLRG